MFPFTASPTPPPPTIVTLVSRRGPAAIVHLADIAAVVIQPPAPRCRRCFLQVLGRNGSFLASVPHRSVKEAQETLALIGRALIAANAA